MTDDGLALIMRPPPSIDYPPYPLVVDEDDGWALWIGWDLWTGGDWWDGMRLLAEGDRVVLAWLTPAEIVPPGSVLSVHSPTGERRASSEVAWPGWIGHSIDPAFLGERIVNVVSSYSGVGVTVHARDGALECKQTLDELGNGHVDVEFAIGFDDREQVAVVAEIVPDDPEESNEPVVVLLGPLP